MKKRIILSLALTFTALQANNFRENIQSAYQGNIYTQYKLAVQYKNAPETQKDLRKAFNLFHKSAVKGYISSQYQLGLMFHYGNGVRQNAELARLWFTRAAKKGHPQAQSVLYRFYSAKRPQSIGTSRYTMNFRKYR